MRMKPVRKKTVTITCSRRNRKRLIVTLVATATGVIVPEADAPKTEEASKSDVEAPKGKLSRY
jgi:hypothetical protein